MIKFNDLNFFSASKNGDILVNKTQNDRWCLIFRTEFIYTNGIIENFHFLRNSKQTKTLSSPDGYGGSCDLSRGGHSTLL